LTQLAVAKRSVTLLLAGALFFLGLSSWSSLKQELLPDIAFPVITVIAPYPGAGAADVADQVAEPIERAISGIPRLESLQSTSANSIALVIAQFSFGSDVKETLATIQENIRSAGLPEGVEPQAQALNINAAPVIIASIAATSEDGLNRAAEIARTEILPELRAIDGVARADVTGGLTDQFMVTLDPDALADAGVSTAQIVGILGANNLTLPAGQLPTGGNRVPVSTIGRITSVEEIRDLTVAYTRPAGGGGGGTPLPSPAPSPEPITLGELGTVEPAGVALTGFGRTNGNP
jgi:HAE1 family hydrophobic/amphiphilic exporter-1